jgi:hypothetical protein
MNLGATSQSDVKLEQVHGVLQALAPIVAGPRVVSAASRSRRCSRAGLDPEESSPE